MHIWTTRFQTLRPLAALPHLRQASSEKILTTAYEFHGKNRQGERHSIFKYTLDGEGVLRDSRGEHRVGKGRGFLTEISDPETSYYYPKAGTEPWTVVYMAFNSGGVESVVQQLKKRHGLVFRLSEKHPVIRRMLEWRRDLNTVRTITPSYGAGFVWELMTALLGSTEGDRLEDPIPLLVRRAQEAVADHIKDNINASEVADMLSVSREHLARRFKEETGITPHEYIVREKMLFACHLLKDTTMSSKEISGRLGYGEPAHFTRTFKRIVQMTPRRFREVGNIPVM